MQKTVITTIGAVSLLILNILAFYLVTDAWPGKLFGVTLALIEIFFFIIYIHKFSISIVSEIINTQPTKKNSAYVSSWRAFVQNVVILLSILSGVFVGLFFLIVFWFAIFGDARPPLIIDIIASYSLYSAVTLGYGWLGYRFGLLVTGRSK